jgi:hypothetical protein
MKTNGVCGEFVCPPATAPDTREGIIKGKVRMAIAAKDMPCSTVRKMDNRWRSQINEKAYRTVCFLKRLTYKLQPYGRNA